MVQLKIGRLLQRRGRTPYWLAKTAGIPQPVAYRLAADDMQRLDLATLGKVCRALSVQPGALLEYVPDD